MNDRQAISDLLASCVELCGQSSPSDLDSAEEHIGQLSSSVIVLSEIVEVLSVGLKSNSFKAQKEALERAREIATECASLPAFGSRPDAGLDSIDWNPSAMLSATLRHEEEIRILREDLNRLVVRVTGVKSLGGNLCRNEP